MEEKLEVFYRICGQILRKFVVLEDTLNFFIANYFIHPQTRKTFLLEDSIIINLSFTKKVSIFKEICESEKVDKNIVRSIVTAVNHLNKIRNKVAHWEAYIAEPHIGDISLESPKSVKFKKDSLTPTEEVWKDFNEKSSFAIRSIDQLHVEFSQRNN